MRRKMVSSDLVECVISLGPNLFYNSSMVSCLLVTNSNKSVDRKGKVLFIQAVDEVRKEKTMSFLDDLHIDKIHSTYVNYEEIHQFSAILENDVIANDKNSRLSVQLYVKRDSVVEDNFSENLQAWEESSEALKGSMETLFNNINSGKQYD